MKVSKQNQQTELVDLLRAASKDEKLFESVLEDMLTPAEFGELAIRWQVVKSLALGKPQRTIAKDLKIGIATVTRGSRVLADKSGGFTKMLKKFKLN